MEEKTELQIDYHPSAIDELISAARFYAEKQQGLGSRFLDAVKNATKFIRVNPLICQADNLGRRKYHVKKFPYTIIYKMKDEYIRILAVAHTSRKPGYWGSRDTAQK